MSCPDCIKGVELSGEPTGSISPDHDGAYFAANPSETSSPHAIILLTDIFGLALKNPKLIADSLAKDLGCDVWVPQLFLGGPFVRPEHLAAPDRPGQGGIGLWGWLKLVFVILPSIATFYRNQPDKVQPRLEAWIKKLQAEKKYERLGAVGYCFGGTLAILLGSGDLVTSVVIAHPGPHSPSAVKALKVPNSWICAEEDSFWPGDKRLAAEADFEGRKGKDSFVDFEFKDYKGTTHGFGARPNLSYPDVKAAFEGAYEQTVNWFKKTVFLA